MAIHRSSHFGLSSNSSSFPIDDVLPFLQIYYASQSINQTKSGKLIQFQRINTDNYQTKSRKLIPVQEPIKYTSKSIDKTKSRKLIQFQEISKTHLKEGLKPVRKRLEIRSCPSSLQQLPSSASTWPSLLQLNDAFHPSHLQCFRVQTQVVATLFQLGPAYSFSITNSPTLLPDTEPPPLALSPLLAKFRHLF